MLTTVLLIVADPVGVVAEVKQKGVATLSTTQLLGTPLTLLDPIILLVTADKVPEVAKPTTDVSTVDPNGTPELTELTFPTVLVVVPVLGEKHTKFVESTVPDRIDEEDDV